MATTTVAALNTPSRWFFASDSGTSALVRNPATWHIEAKVPFDFNMGNNCSEVMLTAPELHQPGRLLRFQSQHLWWKGSLVCGGRLDWSTLPTWQRDWGKHGPFKGRAFRQTTHRVKPPALHALLWPRRQAFLSTLS